MRLNARSLSKKTNFATKLKQTKVEIEQHRNCWVKLCCISFSLLSLSNNYFNQNVVPDGWRKESNELAQVEKVNSSQTSKLQANVFTKLSHQTKGHIIYHFIVLLQSLHESVVSSFEFPS